ncbi:MAG: hypothetical protein RSD68_01955 [Oscillospiraceae bacterium]
MNRQQFLAELTQYLTFVTADERAAIIASFAEKFDAAGTAGEAALLAALGTPMTTAIDLKRRKDSGKAIDGLQSESSTIAESSETEIPEILEAPVPPVPDINLDLYDLTVNEGTSAEEESFAKPPKPPKKVSDKKDPLTAKRLFSIIGSVLLILLTAVFFLAVAAAGVLLVVSMGYLLLMGLQSLHYIADALLLFGGGLVGGALGLLIVWFALWSAISLISKLLQVIKRPTPSAVNEESDN